MKTATFAPEPDDYYGADLGATYGGADPVPNRAHDGRRQGLYDFYSQDPWPAGAGYSHSAMLPRKRGRVGGPHPQSVRAHVSAMGDPANYAWELGEEGDMTNYGQPRVMKTPKDIRKEKK